MKEVANRGFTATGSILTDFLYWKYIGTDSVDISGKKKKKTWTFHDTYLGWNHSALIVNNVNTNQP